MPTDSPMLTCEVTSGDDLEIVTLMGSICDAGINTARTTLCRVLDDGARNVAISMQGVDYISSSGIGMLVSILKRCHQGQRNLALCGLNDDLRELFALTRLDQVFTIARDAETWRKAL